MSPSFDTAFQVNRNVSTHLLSVFPASLVGVLCGALAALFTASNLVTTKLRKVHIGGNKFKQVMEPVLVMVVYTLIAVIIPLMFPVHVDGMHPGRDERAVSRHRGWISTRTGGVSTGERQRGRGGVLRGGQRDHLHRVVEQSMMTFTCRSHWNARGPHRLGRQRHQRHRDQGLQRAATLLHVSSDDAIRHLLTRGTHREFGYGPLFRVPRHLLHRRVLHRRLVHRQRPLRPHARHGARRWVVSWV